MKRRHFLSTACSSAGWITTSAFGQDVYEPPSEETIRISICHTTDLHGNITPTSNYNGDTDLGGFGRCLSQIRDWRKANPNHLVLDIGDLYQGTHVSLETQGSLMVELLNAANFDGWVAGNHDLDWGEKVFRDAVEKSAMPVLSSNLKVDGHRTGDKHHSSGPYSNLVPTLLKEFDGIKIGVVGMITPGLPFWLNPGQLGSVVALDPLVETRKAIRSLQDRGAHCIVAAGHMGLKRGDTDDYANQVNRIVNGCPEIDVFIAGHTHRDRPSTIIGDALFTQAGYFGIWAGKVDLTFLKDGGKLIRRDAETLLMDNRVEEDPLVTQISESHCKSSKEKLQSRVGKLDVELQEGRYEDTGADSQSLIAAGMIHALRKRDENVDGVFHGAFSKETVQPGRKTLEDMWHLVPYENRIVTASVTGEQLKAILEEAYTKTFDRRRLVGFSLETNWNREARKREVTEVKTAKGEPLERDRRYRIAFNSYDAQSGGRKMLLLREILQRPESATTYHPIDTRAALTDFFLDEEVVSKQVIERTTGEHQ